MNSPSTAGILETAHSATGKLRPVPVQDVRLQAGFWLPRVKANLEAGIPRLFEHLDRHGVVENFRIAAGASKAARRGPYFTDSDLYKWMEGAAWALALVDSPAIRRTLDETIDVVVAAQREDGYLNTFFIGEIANQRFRNMPQEHELYCAGHYFQAAVAHHRVTGDTRLLESAVRFADYLYRTFVEEDHPGTSGHEEIEMALVELFRSTGERRYVELAGVFLDRLGVRKQSAVSGHAVRALYRCCGIADYYAETGDEQMGQILERLWHDLVSRKMYITGGAGSRHAAEAVGDPYELPNRRAYAETCAAIANLMFNWRMLNLTGEGRFADVMETALYNGFLAGVSLSGVEYFYVNPLTSTGGYQRQEWHGCTCCPTNAVRLLASLPGHFYSTSPDGLQVHLYDNNRLDTRLQDGSEISVVMETRYPWSGSVSLTVTTDSPREFAVHLRIPATCPESSARVNGEIPPGYVRAGHYFPIRRTWAPGDRIELELPIHAVWHESDSRVRENLGAVSLVRGPLVYCLESPDHPGVDILQAEVDPNAHIEEQFEAELLGGVITLRVPGCERTLPGPLSPLYPRYGSHRALPLKEAMLKAIPYYAWANRGDSRMTVWLPVRED